MLLGAQIFVHVHRLCRLLPLSRKMAFVRSDGGVELRNILAAGSFVLLLMVRMNHEEQK